MAKVMKVLAGTMLLTMVCVSAYPVEPQITVSSGYVSRYIWRGQDLFSDNDPAFQPCVGLSFKTAEDFSLGFNIWSSIPLSDGHENSEEFDYTLYSDIGLLEGMLASSIGFTYYDYPNTTSRADVSEPWFALSLNEIPGFFHPVSFNTFFAYDLQAKSGGIDEGWYYSWGFSTDLKLPATIITTEEQAATFSLTNWGNDGVADLKPAFIYATDLSVSTTYNFNGFDITPSVNYTINHEQAINNGDEEFWSGIGVEYKF